MASISERPPLDTPTVTDLSLAAPASDLPASDSASAPTVAPAQGFILWRRWLRDPRFLAGVAAGIVILFLTFLSRRTSVDFILPMGVILMTTLAYANGTNDVSKAIATLVGSGVTNYRHAILWGALWTSVGSLLSAVFASALIGTFTKGFIAQHVRQTEIFALAVLLGAILWVFFATATSLPVSTTHAITGSLVTVGAVVYGVNNVQWATLLKSVALPLVASPFIALALALIVYLILRLLRLGHGQSRIMNGLHWISSGGASLARGLNDSPKIVALGVAFFLITQHSGAFQAPFWLFALVALGIGLGSYIGGLNVTETLAEKVTKMDHTEGFAANLTTAFLVAFAANLGLPVSTTHVSSGAIIGIGLREGVRRIQWKVVRDMVLAWIVTLPIAGLFGVIVYALLWLMRPGG